MKNSVLHPRSLQLIATVLVISFVLIWFLLPAQETSPPIDEDLVNQGLSVYTSNYCGACHQLDAAETYGQFGPAHNDISLVAQQRVDDDSYYGEAQTAEEFLIESIIDPQAYLHPDYVASSHAMPAFTNLSETDLDAVVYMLMQQQGE